MRNDQDLLIPACCTIIQIEVDYLIVQGLILGTRMYYRFNEEAVATDGAFMQQMDSLTRGTLHHSLPAVDVPVSDSTM